MLLRNLLFNTFFRHPEIETGLNIMPWPFEKQSNFSFFKADDIVSVKQDPIKCIGVRWSIFQFTGGMLTLVVKDSAFDDIIWTLLPRRNLCCLSCDCLPSFTIPPDSTVVCDKELTVQKIHVSNVRAITELLLVIFCCNRKDDAWGIINQTLNVCR